MVFEQAIQSKWGIAPNQLRVFLHYQPSYYHLHVHFVHLASPIQAGTHAGKALLLDDILGKNEAGKGGNKIRRVTINAYAE